MKRILPLILALVAGMAQADSNSDYRAGSDFARQIQGQGTGSIQGFKPQESIPSYNANPDETKYYGGVTAGGDGGLKNDGTTEWATGETGKTITESFMNKPKDILSPDAPFIQTGRDVVNRADSIVGNTGQQCSAQEINRSEFTNYTCERDTMVEEYCTRTASITGDWKYTDEYREVTIPHSQFRFSMNGLKLVFSVTAPVLSDNESKVFFEKVKGQYPEMDIKIPFLTVMETLQYKPAESAAKVQCPVLIVIAGQDSVNPPEQGKALYDAVASGTKELYEEADACHYDIYEGAFFERVAAVQTQWFKKHL